MPMPQDVIPQQQPDLIGQQHEPPLPQPPPQQQAGAEANQGNAGIVRFDHQGESRVSIKAWQTLCVLRPAG
eukprot:19882-Pelagomonas_calceolata.AAC.1